MALQRCVRLLAGERGLYFPINHRILDDRVDPIVATMTDVQSRFRREMRSSFITGETRQVVCPHWSLQRRPTHFLALPLPAKCHMRRRMEQIRKDVLFTHPHVEPLWIPETKLHVTIGVLALPRETSEAVLPTVQKVVQNGLKQYAARRRDTTAGLTLHFTGVGTFAHGRVLFARCAAERGFMALDALVREVRHGLGVGLGLDVKGNPHDSFVPHITMAKIRKHQERIVGDTFPPSVWSEFQHHDFGDTVFTQLDCCEMKGDRGSGYYKVAFSLPV